jgi:Tfp pilus assembly protein PilN
MRELEFLPAWYPQTRRRKSRVQIEGWILAVVIVSLGSWYVFAQQNLRAKQATLGTLQHQLDQVHTERELLNQALDLRQRLQEREELVASLGYPVEMTRLLQTLDSVMPREMTLTDFDCQTREQARPVTSVAAVRPSDRQLDRRLDIHLKGVAPSDVDLANFLGELSKMPFLEQVNVSYSQDKVDSGHRMREFEVTFSMNLNQQ